MPRNVPLSSIVSSIREKIGQNLTAGVAPQLDTILKVAVKSKQDWLATQFIFPFLKETRWDIAVAAGTRYVLLPAFDINNLEATIKPNALREFEIGALWGNDYLYREVLYGIGIAEMNTRNSDQDIRMDPIMRIQFGPDTTMAAPAVPDGNPAGTGTGVLNGVLQYAFSLVTPYGETDLSPIFTTNNLVNKQMALGSLITTAGYETVVIGKRIYRTKAGGSVFYYLTEVDFDVLSYTDNTADSSLTELWSLTVSPLYLNRFEVWPIPITNHTLRFQGERELRRLEEDSDPCDLDSDCLIYMVAADYTAAHGLPGAATLAGLAKSAFDAIAASYPKPTMRMLLGRRPEKEHRNQKLVAIA